jgi:betaine-aldehyde dehydrogenase
MQPPAKLLIDGNFLEGSSGQKLTLVNPATEEPWAEVAAAGIPDVHKSVEGAQQAFVGGWRDLIPGRRQEILYHIARSLRNKSDEIALMESRNTGKPIRDARDEALFGARIFEYYAGAISMFYGQTIPVGRGGFDFTLRQPMGVVAAIVPWNFPFPIACWKAAPALAAGNCVVLKPASLTPVTALMLGEIALEAGLPPGVLQVIPGKGSENGDALVTHSLVNKISFTGSTEIGKRIMGLAAGGLKRISLELGGKSPNIIFADGDWEKAADQSPLSVFANAGQDCCARSRFFVERSIYRDFLDCFAGAVRKLVVGDPQNPETEVGPMISRGQRASVEEFLREIAGKQAGVEGGERPFGKGYYLTPAIVTDVETKERIWREEVFGPVVCIRPFANESAMIREANDTPYGLSGSLWTRDLQRALRVSRQIESGVLSINSHSSVHLEAPFGGFKQSGIGRDLGMAAMEGYSEVKNIYIAG